MVPARTAVFLASSISCVLSSALVAQTAPASAPAPPACDRLVSLGQTGLSGPYAEYARAAELAGAAPLRPRLIRRPSEERTLALCGDPGAVPWAAELHEDPIGDRIELRILPVGVAAQVNSAYPVDRNNGALWEGRGLSTMLTGGIEARWGAVSAGLAPLVAYQQNRDFPVPGSARGAGYSPFAHPWRPNTIDWPYRFGDEPFWTLDPGQSYIRVDAYRLTLGFSTENLWWGPATRHPLLMSNTAPGFPHIFFGTSGPLDTRIGRIEAQLLWGRLSESAYFDGNPDNDHRLLAGFVADFQPAGIPGLSIGAARVHMQSIPPGGLSMRDWILGAYTDTRANPQGIGNPEADNQLLSLFMRWAFPEVGFETYAEWARDDHWADWKDLLREPDHTQAYTLGFQKVTPAGERWVRFYGELVHLGGSPTHRSGRGYPSFYTHGQLRQGYTHRGQLLGAAIGPGSDAQILGADLFTRRGRIGAFVERARYDDDAYYMIWARYYGFHGHDVELSGGLHQLLFLRDFDLSWGLKYSHRYSRNFLGLDGANWDFLTEGNWNLEVGLNWRPASLLRPPRPSATVVGPR